ITNGIAKLLSMAGHIRTRAWSGGARPTMGATVGRPAIMISSPEIRARLFILFPHRSPLSYAIRPSERRHVDIASHFSGDSRRCALRERPRLPRPPGALRAGL